MKLAENVGTLVQEGAFLHKGTCRIHNSAKAFDILSSGLYSNKAKAIVRELACNAADAHVSAGTENVAFTVHLPNEFEPYFSIRDFGTGLSRDDFENKYAVFFLSDKTDSDKYTGCMGLGSKSPLAYTDNFTVTSYYNGTQYSYVWYKDADGIPAWALAGEQETDEPNGLEVQFSVLFKDFDDFYKETENVLRYFQAPFTVTGHKIDPEIKNILFEGDDWKIIKEGKFAVMGNVAYPIDNTWKLSGGAWKALSYKGVVLYFDIGELDITASRESLDYTPKTISAIQHACDENYSTVLSLWSDTIKDQPSYFAACVFAANSDFPDFVYDKLNYNGKVLKRNFDLKTTVVQYKKARANAINKSTVCDFSLYSTPTFVLRDLDKTVDLRCRKRAITSQNPVILVEDVDSFLLEVEADESCLVKLSELPFDKPVRSSTPTVTAYKFNYHGQGHQHWHQNGTYWKSVKLDVKQKGYYVTHKRYIVNHPDGGSCENHNVSKIAYILGVANNLYAVNPKREKRLKKLGWVNLFDLAADYIQQLQASPTDMEILELNQSVRYATYSFDEVCTINVPETQEIRHYRNKVRKLTDANKKQAENFELFYYVFNQDIPECHLKELTEAFFQKYPLLRNVHFDEDILTDVKDYITLVNNRT